MWTDNETDQDLLGYKVHKDLIKSVVTDRSILPVSMGLFGDWGSGKSSIMKMLEKDLAEDSSIICIYFNGWVFEGYDDAKAALIEGILECLKQNKTLDKSIIDKIGGLAKRVNWLRAGGFFVKNIAIPAAMAYATGGVSLVAQASGLISKIQSDGIGVLESESAKNLLGELSGVVQSKPEEQTSMIVRQFRDDFEELIKDTGKTLVVLIDDLDRCSPERIIENLEAIKLFLNVPNTAFVIGADERIVRHAIEYRYNETTKSYKSEEIKEYNTLVTDYLEKLIQIPYRIPKLSSTDVSTYMNLLFSQRELQDKYNEIVDDFQQFRESDKHTGYSIEDISKIAAGNPNIEKIKIAEQIAPLVCKGLKGNPRQIKRFLNSYVLRKKLADVANFKLEDDVLAKLMVLEYIRLPLFAELFTWQQQSDGKPQEIVELENNAKCEHTDKLMAKWNDPEVIKWLTMDPSLSGIDLMNYFWITRDRIKDTMDTSSMIPIAVSQMLTKLENSSGERYLSNIIKTDVPLLDPNNIDILYNDIHNRIIKEPQNIKLWDIIQQAVVENDAVAKRYYISLFDLVNWGQVAPGIAVKMKEIMGAEADILALKSRIKNQKITRALGMEARAKTSK